MAETVIHSGKLRSMASLYIRQNDRLLLLFRQGNSIVSNLWIGSAGGHFEAKELTDAKACVLRELQEELGIPVEDLEHLTLRYITIRYTDGEIRQNYYFFADLKSHIDIAPPSTEGITRWFTLEETNNLPMPLTAQMVLGHYQKTGQFDDLLYGCFATTSDSPFIQL